VKTFKEWPKKYRVLLMFAWGIFIFFLCLNRCHAAEPSNSDRIIELTKDAAIDTLVATVTMIGAAEQAAIGNFCHGPLALATISGTEFCRAYSEAKEAWNLLL